MQLEKQVTFIFGDSILGSEIINEIKDSYSGYNWSSVCFSRENLKDIKILCKSCGIFDIAKIVLIKDIKNTKEFKDLVLSLTKSTLDNLKIIIWDSSEIINIDPKIGVNKTWSDFFNKCKVSNNFKFINNGSDFHEKDNIKINNYVRDLFLKNNRRIDKKNIDLFVEIVGKNRGIIYSEVKKLCITAKEEIDKQFILENTFPSSKSFVFYNITNYLDKSYKASISEMEYLISIGKDPYYIGNLILFKAKWNLAIADLYRQGNDWFNIKDLILKVGKFPSSVWSNDQIPDSKKKKLSDNLKDPRNLKEFMLSAWGCPYYLLDCGTEKRVSDSINSSFIADMMVKSFRYNQVPKTKSKVDLVNRSLRIYIECCQEIKEIRFGDSNPVICLKNMINPWFF